MIIHIAGDLMTRPIEPIRIVDVSPLHTDLSARRPAALKVQRWIPRLAAACLAVGIGVRALVA
jgi:hypothetical protein